MTAIPNLIACHDCDLLQRETPLQPGGVALCTRCGAVLYRHNPGNVERALALTIAAAVLFALSNFFPLAGIESRGNRIASTLFGAVLHLWNEHMESVAILVFVTAILVPALELALMIFLLAARSPSPLVLRILLVTRPWAMIEVFMLGLLVSVQRLTHIANIDTGVALWSFGALMVLFAALTATFNVRDLWNSIPPGHLHANR